MGEIWLLFLFFITHTYKVVKLKPWREEDIQRKGKGTYIMHNINYQCIFLDLSWVKNKYTMTS